MNKIGAYANFKAFYEFVDFRTAICCFDFLKNIPHSNSSSRIYMSKFLFPADILIICLIEVAYETIEVPFYMAHRPKLAIFPLPYPTFWPHIMIAAALKCSGYVPKTYIPTYPPNEPPTRQTFYCLHNFFFAAITVYKQESSVSSSLAKLPCPGRSMRIERYPFYLAKILA